MIIAYMGLDMLSGSHTVAQAPPQTMQLTDNATFLSFA